MSLRSIAATDAKAALEDITGFGWEIKITDPNGTAVTLTGFSTDISQVIDPETGVIISGRAASITLAISSLTSAGLGLPQNISDTAGKPWTIEFDDINGNSQKFKVSKSNPDRAIGVVVCHLELYK